MRLKAKADRRWTKISAVLEAATKPMSAEEISQELRIDLNNRQIGWLCSRRGAVATGNPGVTKWTI